MLNKIIYNWWKSIDRTIFITTFFLIIIGALLSFAATPQPGPQGRPRTRNHPHEEPKSTVRQRSPQHAPPAHSPSGAPQPHFPITLYHSCTKGFAFRKGPFPARLRLIFLRRNGSSCEGGRVQPEKSSSPEPK